MQRNTYRFAWVAALLIALSSHSSAGTRLAETGSIWIASQSACRLEIRGPEGQRIDVEVPPGGKILDFLSPGTYAAVALREGKPAGEACWVVVAPGRTSRLRMEGSMLHPEGFADECGSALILDRTALEALPGSPSAVLGALDTHRLLRPDSQIDGVETGSLTQRRAMTPEPDGAMALAAASISPGPGMAAARHRLCSVVVRQTSDTRVGAQVWGDDRSGGIFGLDGAMPQRFLLGLGISGGLSLGVANLKDGDPRPWGDKPLPHNGLYRLDVLGNLRVGWKEHAGIEGPEGIEIGLLARGLEREHYLHIYKQVPEHGPKQRLALFSAWAGGYKPIGEELQIGIRAGVRRFYQSLADGVFGSDLASYRLPREVNAWNDGYYWDENNEWVDEKLPHRFDYYLRESLTSTFIEADLRTNRNPGTRLGAGMRIRLHSYRRFEHFAPISWNSENDSTGWHSVRMGYDESGRLSGSPMRPLEAELRLRASGIRGPLAWGVSAGLFMMHSGSKSIVRSGATVDPQSFESASTKLVPEWYAGGRRILGRGISTWALAYGDARMPPLEAMIPPEHYLGAAPLDGSLHEGAMGNPDLQPEREYGLEIGVGASSSGRIDAGLALYGTYETNLPALDYVNLKGDWVPTYTSGASRRRLGVHVQADWRASKRLRCIASYDFSRTYTDRFEPPLLEEPWLYPNDPRGEYATEGYPGPLGGLWDDQYGTLQPGRMEPADSDRPHVLGAAVIIEMPEWETSVVTRALSGYTVGVLLSWKSGRPYTPCDPYDTTIPPVAEVSEDTREVGQPPKGTVRNSERMPSTFRIDLAASRALRLWGARMRIRLEVMNLLDERNVVAVYRATGEPDEDGFHSQEGGTGVLVAYEQGDSEEKLAERLRDPRHYDTPLSIRFGLSLYLD